MRARVDDLVDGRGLLGRHEGSRADPREIEQVADEPVQPVGLLEDGRQELPALRRSSERDVVWSRLVTPALIEASGVRRSCVTEENSAARSLVHLGLAAGPAI